MDDPGEVESALRGTVLDGHRVEEGLGGTLLVADVDPGDVVSAWRAAHGALALTDRWPVFTDEGQLYNEPTPADLDELDRAARSVDPWPELLRPADAEPINQDRFERYVTACVGADRVPEAAARLGLSTSLAALDRWVYDTLLADPALAQRSRPWFERLIGPGNWYRPDRIQLVLLPTPHQWLTPAFTSYFGARSDRIWAAAMYQWHRRWDARLVACWGTMLQFFVGQRPEPGEPAWELAGQIMGVGGSLQEERWMHAMAVAESDAWFLHDRP